MVRVLYYVLVVLCIGISLYLTYFGFERTFQNLTLAFTAVIGVLLFGADFLIQRNRERGDPSLGAFGLFIIAAFFSSVSNFNYLYTNFMTSDVLASTLREQYKVFRNDLGQTKKALQVIDAVQKEEARRDIVDQKLAELWKQITDPGRPGCGKRCRELMSNISGLLGVTITDLSLPGRSANNAQLKIFYDNYRSLVFGALDSTSGGTPYLEVASLRKKIDETLRYYGTADSALQAGSGLSVLSDLSEASQEIERNANTLLNGTKVVKHTYIDPTLGRLGEIVYSLKNGFVEVPNLAATLMALILSLLVDFVPVIFAFVAFRPGESSLPETTPADMDILNF